jgi:hypothetical protein
VVRTGLLAALFLGLTWLCFRRWAPEVLFGDDLYNYQAYLKGAFYRTWPQVLFGGFEDKYRPVDSLAMKAMFDLFGAHLRPVRDLDFALNALCGLLVERIAFTLSGRRIAVSVLAAIMVVTSRFALYQATLLTSVLEAIGFALFLAMLAAVVALYRTPADDEARGLRPSVLAVAAYWLVVLDHERYLAAAPWLAVMLWFAPARRGAPPLVRAWAPLAVLAAAVFNVGYKALLLRQGVMVGTGGSSLTVNLSTAADHGWQALASVFAFNHGPAYLVGRDLFAAPYDWVTFAAGAFIFFLLMLLAFGLAARANDPDPDRAGVGNAFFPVALAVLAALILVPPMLTIRMEQRWLVEPFALLVLVGAWAAGQVHDVNRAIRLFLAWAAASVAVDVGLSAGFGSIFFISAGRAAATVKSDVIDRLPAGSGAMLVANKDICGWSLQGADFFRLYAPGRGPFTCVTDVKQIGLAVDASAAPPDVYRIVPGNPAQDIDGLLDGDRAYAAETRRLEFLERFDQGQINDPKHMDSPSGKGATPITLDVGGEERKGMAVITGFTYRFDHVPVQPGDRLEFEAAMAFPTKGPGRARVTVAGADGKPVDVASDLLPFRTKAGPPSMTHASIPLDRFGKEVSVTFAAETPPGVDPTAQWVVYLRPRIAAPNASPSPLP